MNKVNEKLRVHHYPQIPCKPFVVDVKDEVEAKKVMDVLINQHCFLFENKIIPDYSNVIMVLMWNEEENDWLSYWNEDEQMEWDEFEKTYLK